MNDIRPFRGLRFDPEVTGPLGNVVCPPYDVISPLEQLQLYAKSSFNAVRLELGLEFPEDGPLSNRYTRAANTMDRWLSQGVLKEDRQPALYLYEQQFQQGGKTISRLGLLARLKLARWDEGVVLPHETTMSKPKEDRLQLMRATASNLSPIFIIFDDPSGAVLSAMQGVVAADAPTGAADTGDGQLHRLWSIVGATQEQLLRGLAEPQLYIADGHHRYETALAYRDERRATAAGADGEAGYDFVMVMLVDARDPGLVVLPTHRLVLDADAVQRVRLDESALDGFEIEEVEVGGSDAGDIAGAMLRRMGEGNPDVVSLGAYGGRSTPPLLLRYDRRQITTTAGGRPLLDVDLLHDRLLGPLFGIGYEEMRAGSRLEYRRDASEAIAEVDDGRAAVAFLLNRTPVDQVLFTARANGKMPQKSTYFYPKPETGLVISRL